MRTAAIVGTASVVGGSVAHHQQQKYADQDAQAAAAAPEPQAYEPPAPPPPPAPVDPTAELTQLAQLHSQGILTDEEFAAKKALILGI
jgi:hypothetical protein